MTSPCAGAKAPARKEYTPTLRLGMTHHEDPVSEPVPRRVLACLAPRSPTSAPGDGQVASVNPPRRSFGKLVAARNSRVPGGHEADQSDRFLAKGAAAAAAIRPDQICRLPLAGSRQGGELAARRDATRALKAFLYGFVYTSRLGVGAQDIRRCGDGALHLFLAAGGAERPNFVGPCDRLLVCSSRSPARRARRRFYRACGTFLAPRCPSR